MTTLTIRDIPDDVAERLRSSARSTGTSMNATMIRILTEGVCPKVKHKPRNDFSRFCGGWSKAEFDAFESAVSECERIDEDAWR